MNSMQIILLLLVMLHMLPIAITQLLVLEYPFDEWENGSIIKWISTAANVILNGLALVLVLLVYYRVAKFNILEVLTFSCSYQDISRLATSNIICLILSVLIGIGEYIGVCIYYQDERFFRFSGKYILLFSLAAVPILVGYQYGSSGTSNLAIQEVCRKTTIVDTAVCSWNEDIIDDGGCYVVIVNNGVLACELDQVYLSDNEDELQEQAIQPIAIEPGETYQFYMFSEDSLNIKKGGGSIVYLSNKFGNVVDRVEVPALKRDESYLNMETGWQIVNVVKTEKTIAVSAPSFSKEGGFYDEAFELELTASPGTTIYYTIDSSDPTIESMRYFQPIYVYDRSDEENQYRSIRNVRRDYLNYSFDGQIPVDKCFVVRAIAVDSNGNCSDIITKSYFVNQEKYKDRTVISLVSDPYGLFDDEYGICVTGKSYDEWYLEANENRDEDGALDTSNMPTENYLQQGIEWERESSFEVYENANLLLAQQVGIRVQGYTSRYNYYDKRFSIYARDVYSFSDYFDVDLINSHSQHALLLREGDLYAISQLVGQGRDVATIEFVPVDVFLDGEFWYTRYLYEKFNKKNFSQKYNLSKDNIVIVKNGEDTDGMNEGNNPYSNLSTFISRNDLSDDEAYWKYSEILDIQSFIDSYCINIFLLNSDHQERWNNLFWHTIIHENAQEGDARWRLGLYDMDLKWNVAESRNSAVPAYEMDPFSTKVGYLWGPINEWPIYSALRKNGNFCKQFVLTFMDLINTNFSVENTTAIMESLGIKNASYQSFFENRAKYIVPYMAEEFELTGTQETVTLSSNISGTPITLNTISPEFVPSAEAFLWTGSYFTDYPVTATANAPNFSHWEITANGSVQRLTDTTIEVPVSRGGVQIHAIFK